AAVGASPSPRWSAAPERRASSSCRRDAEKPGPRLRASDVPSAHQDDARLSRRVQARASSLPLPQVAKQTRTPVKAKESSRSDLNLDDALNPEISDGLHYPGPDKHHLAHVLLKYRLHVVTIKD